jgi:hypothetical protein
MRHARTAAIEKSRMTLFRTLFAAMVAATLTGAPALAAPPRDSDRAFKATQ